MEETSPPLFLFVSSSPPNPPPPPPPPPPLLLLSSALHLVTEFGQPVRELILVKHNTTTPQAGSGQGAEQHQKTAPGLDSSVNLRSGSPLESFNRC